MRSTLLALAFLCCCGLAFGTPITYTIAGIASGAVFLQFPDSTGESDFTNAAFSFNLSGDTSTPVSAVEFSPLDSAAVVSVGSFSGVMTTATGLLSYTGALDLYNQNPINSILELSSPLLNTYDIKEAIGPVDVTAVINQQMRDNGALINTSFGTLTLSDVSDVTFTATVPTPEPQPAILALFGIIGLFAAKTSVRRRESVRTSLEN